MRRRFKCDPNWIAVRYSAQMREARLYSPITAGERAFYYPADRGLYGVRCGHGEQVAHDFAAHRLDEDGY